MKRFTLISIVLFCLFVLKCESIDFCEEFAKNDFRIDYSFSAIGLTVGSKSPVFVIGYNYWYIYPGGILNQHSGTMSPIFGSNYSSAFSVLKNKTNSLIAFGFLRINDLVIEWKELTSSEYNATDNVVKETSVRVPFPQDFVPSVSFLINKDRNEEVVLTFVGQNQTSDSETNVYKRTYISIFFKILKNGSIEPLLYQKTNTYYNVVNESNGEGLVVAAFGPYSSPNDPTKYYTKFFVNKTSIDFCNVEVKDDTDFSLDQMCLNQRKRLIDCSAYEITPEVTATQETTEVIDSKLWKILTIIGIISVVLIFICCLLFWMNIGNVRNRLCKTKPRNPRKFVFETNPINTSSVPVLSGEMTSDSSSSSLSSSVQSGAKTHPVVSGKADKTPLLSTSNKSPNIDSSKVIKTPKPDSSQKESQKSWPTKQKPKK